MTGKPPLWADWLLAFWVLVVAGFYFGSYGYPLLIGSYIQAGAGIYALMLLVSAGALAWKYLTRTKPRK